MADRPRVGEDRGKQRDRAEVPIIEHRSAGADFVEERYAERVFRRGIPVPSSADLPRKHKLTAG